jgi:hypothetical protein
MGPNAGAHLLPEAGATQERTLEAVRCSALFGGCALGFGSCSGLFSPERTLLKALDFSQHVLGSGFPS